MTALAERVPPQSRAPLATPGERQSSGPGRRPRPKGPRTSWNVLAEELIDFEPPAPRAGRVERRPGARPVAIAGAAAPGHARSVPRPAARRVAGAEAPSGFAQPAAVAPVVRLRPAAAPSTRGLRRLLPGAATLAVLCGIWFGVGALSTVHQPQPVLLRGAVQTAGGQVYVAHAGDTLWTIATRVEPGGDPRTLVANLEQQLHGAELVPGDRLLLP